MSPLARNRLIALLVGVLLLGVGGVLLGGPLIGRAVAIVQVNERGNVDSQALSSWNAGGSSQLTGCVGTQSSSHNCSTPATAAPGAEALGTCSPGGAPAASYALVEFTGLPQFSYAGVAGDGNWSLLDTRSMVHYSTTPAPGQRGNVIIAFHREPDYQYINELTPGKTVTIQDRQCNVYVYTIENQWVEQPTDVNQLAATSGYDLTLITCTPFWQDYERIVWRADLTSVNGKPFKG